MRLARIILWALILIFLVLLCVFFITGGSWADCTPGSFRTGSFGGNSWNAPEGTHIPKSLLPVGGPNYTYSYSSYVGPSCAGRLNGWHNGNQYWMLENDAQCTGYTGQSSVIIYYETTGNPGTLDFDCDGISDGNDPFPGDPSKPSGTAKYRKTIGFKNKTSGVEYWLYRGDDNSWFWTSTDGGGVPTTFDSNYRALVDIYAQTAPSKTWAEWGITLPTSNDGVDRTALFTGDEGTTVTSPGKDSGGYSGNAPTSGSTSDWTTMYDYLRGIQQNSKGTNDAMINLDNDLQKIKQNQTLQGAGIGSGTGNQQQTQIDPRPNIDALGSKLDTIKNDLEGTPDALPDIPTEGMSDDTEYSEESGGTKKGVITEWLSGVLDTAWAGSPIKSLLSSSGVECGGSSAVSLDLGDYGSFSFDLAVYDGILALFGDFIVMFAGLAGIISMFRD